MPLVNPPKEFLSSISGKLMTEAVETNNSRFADRSEYPYYYVTPHDLNEKLQAFRRQLFTDAEFIQAILDNNQDLLAKKNYIASQLNSVFEPNKYSVWKGYRPLDIAILRGNVEIAKQFIADGAPLNLKNEHFGQYPIQIAAQKENLSLVKLIDEKAHDTINLYDVRGYTALHFAAESGNQELVEFLVNQGARQRMAHSDESTPFIQALIFGHFAIAKWLFLKNPDSAGAFCDEEKNPLAIAVKRNAFEIVNLMLQHSDEGLETKDGTGLTPLHMAVQKNHPDLVELLIAKGANVNTKDTNGDTLFHTAAKIKDSQPILFSLIKTHASIFEKNKQGKSATDLAHETGRLENKTILLQYMIDADKENVLEKQAMQIANNKFAMMERKELFELQKQEQQKILESLTAMQTKLNKNIEMQDAVIKEQSAIKGDIQMLTNNVHYIKTLAETIAMKITNIQDYMENEKKRRLDKAEEKAEAANLQLFSKPHRQKR